MSLAAWKLFGAVALAVLLSAVGAAAAWQVQGWRYGKQLAEQAGLTAIGNAANNQQQAEQAKRQALEQRLAAADKSHYQELKNVRNDQVRLRDRIATADLRLSVLLDATDPATGCAVPATTAASGVVHGSARARLDPAHAQRIIGITDDGDQGLIALAACQAYVKEVSTLK
ncbi:MULTISPECIES: lysis system i-spanin subunit Rz [unclassified Pseudomonas]|uniref:lysis system i-spanin subunit Rz n=1 Tax=unclassified Pseudomonas TaxID=196821 RepID=UPI000C2FA64A|nr:MULTISPECIES: lysis system i-spanin subunit Rz [unclassified Pseudomonas]MCU1738839.1 lysis protein [Pseudomonas sp. 20S_6.2_Bac1]